jgi:hypothetical protein
MRAAHAVLAVCLSLGATACGEAQTEEAEVASAYNAVVDAVQEKDYDQACEGLTDTTRQALSKAATIEGTDGCGATLERVVAGVGVDERALTAAAESDVEITSDSTATVRDVRMSKQDEEWRLEGDLDFVRPFLSGESRPQ